MKIAITCFNLGWQSGGPRLIFSAAQAMKRAGHTVVIYTPEWTGEYFKELWAGLDIRNVQPAYSFTWAGRPKSLIAKIIRKLKQEYLYYDTARRIAAAMDDDFDLVNVHDFSYLVGLYYKRRNSKTKIFWTENDPPYAYLPKDKRVFDILSRFYNWLKDISSRRFFKVIDAAGVLDSHNELWCRERGLKTVLTRLGVEAAFTLPVKEVTQKFSAKKVRLFGLGSLNRPRRYEDTILAIKYLRDWGYDASLLLICNDLWNEAEYRNYLLSLVKENGLDQAVEFNFKGVPEEGLKEAYKETDVFVYSVYLPPPRNGFGFSIGVFEAMAAGLPVVLCRTTTSTEVLEDKKSGLFVDPMSPEQIAQQIKFVVDNPQAYKTIAASGQKLVATELTWDKYVERMLSFLK